jgi:hypothetical protein
LQVRQHLRERDTELGQIGSIVGRFEYLFSIFAGATGKLMLSFLRYTSRNFIESLGYLL